MRGLRCPEPRPCRAPRVRGKPLRGPCRLPCEPCVCRVPGRAREVCVEGPGTRGGGRPPSGACQVRRRSAEQPGGVQRPLCTGTPHTPSAQPPVLRWALLHMSSTGHTTHYSIERRSRHCSLRLTLAPRRSSERPTTIQVRTTKGATRSRQERSGANTRVALYGVMASRHCACLLVGLYLLP